jgi:tight adherence protein B
MRAYNRQLVRVLDVIVLSLRSGAGLIGAVREAAMAHDGVVEADLREVIRHVDLGISFEQALQVWVQRSSLRSVRLAVACITLAYETGGSSAQSIGAVRMTVRNALSAEASVQANAAQARASAILLAALPLVLSGPMIAFNATARLFMLHTPAGVAILLGGLTLDAIGFWWMSSMIAKAES